MFSASMTGVSVLSFSCFQSVKEMVLKHTMAYTEDNHVQFINDNADIYIPFSAELKIDSNFPNFSPSVSGDTTLQNMIPFEIFKQGNIDPQITTITYNRTLSLPTLLKQLASDPSVYGVVIQAGGRDKYVINPLHPMISFMIAAGLHELPEEGELHVYNWKKDKVGIANKDDSGTNAVISKYVSDYTEFFNLSEHIIKEPVKVTQVASVSDSAITSIIREPSIENIHDISIDIRRSEPGDRDISRIKTVVIPNQLAIDGTLSPYYGVTLLNNPTKHTIKGQSLSPAISGNINCQYRDSSTYRQLYNSAGSDNVCAGGANAASPKGWFTLSRVNLSSMFFQDIIVEDDYYAFVQASKKISADTWSVIEAKLDKEFNEALDEKSSAEEV